MFIAAEQLMDPNARRSSEGCAGAEPAVPNPENGEKHSAEEKVGPLGPPRNRVGACRVRDWRPTAAGLRCDSGAVDEARRAIRLPLTRPVRSFRAVTDQECTQHTPTGGRRQGIQAGTDPPDAHGAHGASMVLPTLVSALQSHPPTLGKARTTQTRELPDQTAWEFATVLCGGGGIRRQPVMTCEHTTKPDTSGSVAWGPWQVERTLARRCRQRCVHPRWIGLGVQQPQARRRHLGRLSRGRGPVPRLLRAALRQRTACTAGPSSNDGRSSR